MEIEIGSLRRQLQLLSKADDEANQLHLDPAQRKEQRDSLQSVYNAIVKDVGGQLINQSEQKYVHRAAKAALREPRLEGVDRKDGVPEADRG